eukprot:116771_1
MGNKASKKQKSKQTEDTNDQETPNDELDTDEKISTPLPSAVERILAQQQQQQETEEQLTLTFSGTLCDQPLIDDKPSMLVLLKKYFFQYNAAKYSGIFANGSLNDEDINKSPEFISNGIVTLNDCNTVKKLIETNKITLTKFQIPNYNNNDKYYAMIFAELIKIWLFELSEPLLQPMPSTFFDGITEIDYLELDIYKVPEPQLSSLLLLWDICVEIDNQKEINKMDATKLAIIFSPYLYKDKDEERNEQIQSALVTFFEIGITWKQQSTT